MGYGKGGSKGKQALAKQYEELSSERSFALGEIVVGAVLVVLALAVNGISLFAAIIPADLQNTFMIGGLVVTFIGAITAAIGCIKLSQVNPEYKRVKSKIGY